MDGSFRTLRSGLREILQYRLTLSPAGDDLTLAFAKTLIDAEQIGQDEVTDYLSVSFPPTTSGTSSGPRARSRRTSCASTARSLDSPSSTSAGLKHVLIVLSADHVDPRPPAS
jgi:hypothetical protein